MSADLLPEPLAEIRDEFLSLGVRDRLLLLLDYSGTLPELPERLASHPDLLERVPECQSPVFVIAEVQDGVVQVSATAPQEAPTTRGFASVLSHGLSGLTPAEVLAVPADYPQTLGLGEAVSPLRVRGMVGLLDRIKRQVERETAAG